MSGWQDWAVAVLLLYCTVRMAIGGYRFMHRMNNKWNPCDGCPECGCHGHGTDSHGKACGCSGKKKKKSCCG